MLETGIVTLCVGVDLSTVSHDESHGVGLRERQHRDVELHGGAVRGVDV